METTQDPCSSSKTLLVYKVLERQAGHSRQFPSGVSESLHILSSEGRAKLATCFCKLCLHFARPQRLALTKGAGMGKLIMHCHCFYNAQSHHASHSELHDISMHCIHDVLPEQESVQAISPSQRSWIDWPLGLDRLADGAERMFAHTSLCTTYVKA